MRRSSWSWRAGWRGANGSGDPPPSHPAEPATAAAARAAHAALQAAAAAAAAAPEEGEVEGLNWVMDRALMLANAKDCFQA